MKKRKCLQRMAQGGAVYPQERPVQAPKEPEWKQTLAAIRDSLVGNSQPKEKPPTGNTIPETAGAIVNRKVESLDAMKRAGYAAGGILQESDPFFSNVQSSRITTGATPTDNPAVTPQWKPMETGQSLGYVGGYDYRGVDPQRGMVQQAEQPSTRQVVRPPVDTSSMTFAEKDRALGLDPNRMYQAGSPSDPHASSGLYQAALQKIANPAPLPTNQPVQIPQAPEFQPRRRRGMADGGMTVFKGKGGPRDDKIPVTVAGEKINVSNGEAGLILPAKTAKNPQALAQIAQTIQQSNDGRAPKMGIETGGTYQNGAMHLVDSNGQVYLNGRPAGYLPAPEAPEVTRTNFFTDKAGTTRAAGQARTAVGPYTGPGTAVTNYVPNAQAATPVATTQAIAKPGMAYQAGKAAGSAYSKAGGMTGILGKAANIAVPAIAAAQTFGDNQITVQGNRAADPGYDEMSGMPRVVSSLKEAALKAGDWGTKGLDILGGWALPAGETSFNDAYRQGVGQLEGVNAPTSQQIQAKARQQQIANAPQAGYSNEGRGSAIQARNITPNQAISQNTGNAGNARVNPETGNLHFTQPGFDPTQQQFAQGTGAITGKDGRTIVVTPGNYTAADGTPTQDWYKTQAYADAIARNEKDNAWLARMQAERQGRDPVQALATEQGMAIAAQKAPLERQLTQQQIAQGQNSLAQQAQLEQARQAIAKTPAGPERDAAIQIYQALNGKLDNKPIAVDMGETISPDGMMKSKNPNVLYDPNTRQTIALNGGQQPPVPEASQRKVGQIYPTPQGPMIWRGNGWERVA